MIVLEHISKSYEGKVILSDFSLCVNKNEFITIEGASGSGKTTLLNIIGLLDRPDGGTITVSDIQNPKLKESTYLRRYVLGYVFQNYVLMNNETVRNNLLISKAYNKAFSEALMLDSIKKVGLDSSILEKKVYQLSGGEQQRVSIARVMLKPCEIVLADEPTGNLDSKNKTIIISLLHELRNSGKTIICATHDAELSHRADKVIKIDLEDKKNE